MKKVVLSIIVLCIYLNLIGCSHDYIYRIPRAERSKELSDINKIGAHKLMVRVNSNDFSKGGFGYSITGITFVNKFGSEKIEWGDVGYISSYNDKSHKTVAVIIGCTGGLIIGANVPVRKNANLPGSEKT